MPFPPPLTAMLHHHIEQYGVAEDGQLFRSMDGGDIAESTLARVWDRASKAALTPEEYRSPLTRRPYDLRHACVSTWLAPSVRGDLSVTTNGSGVQVGSLRTYTPYGEALRADGTVDNQAVPDNQPGNMDYGWLGQNQREYEHAGALSLVQMGERPYSPLLGRFLSVDPVDGGSANDYVNADPINHVDLDGTSFLGWLGNTVKSAFTDHLTTTLSVLAVATSWVPFVGVAFTVAAAVSSGYDAYNDFRHGDILGGILDIAGGFTGVGGLIKHAAAYASKKAAAKLFTKATSFRGVANSGRWARKAARQGAKQVCAAARYSAREKRYTGYGIAATAL